MRSSSSLRSVPLGNKIGEAIQVMRMHLARRRFDPARYPYDALVDEYSAILARHGTIDIFQRRTLEIGYGARPFRLAWLFNRGIDVRGVDLDMPLMKWTPGNLVRIGRQSGWIRAAKSSVRYFLSDLKEWASIGRMFAETHGTPFRLPLDRLAVANAASDAFWDAAGTLGLVYSEDVFEHIPRENLGNLVERMARALAPDGLAIIRPNVFTGITGGHHIEWYPHRVPDTETPRQTEPWEHLRQNRRPADTFLNGMTRRDYVALFSRYFEILENRAEAPDLGRSYMSDAIRTELAAYDDDELFSNRVLFVLKPR